MKIFMILVIYLLGAPIVGGILAGVDRIISARMQSRVGPPVLQPFFDVIKLFSKENLVVRRSQTFYIFFYLLFVVFTGSLFFTGGDILLVIFAFTLAGIFFVLAGYKASSPYSFIGAERELLQMISYEPMIIIAAVGMYMVTKSFSVSDIFSYSYPMARFLPGIFLGFLFLLPLKFRKSPYDISTSHHGHQELVKGITTEFSGPSLAMVEIAHWYETVFVLGFIYLFFANHALMAIGVTLVSFFLVILIDNTFARVKWQLVVKSLWLVALVLGMGKVVVLSFFR